MQTRLLFMLILAVGYAALNSAVTAWYRRSFRRDDNFLGDRAPDAVQRFFGRAVPAGHALLCGRDPGADPAKRPGWSHLVHTWLDVPRRAGSRIRTRHPQSGHDGPGAPQPGQRWRVGLDAGTQDALVTTGFYRYVRNPYFSFLLLFQGALCLVAPTALVFCALIQSALLLALQVRHEEAFLLQKYGSQYAAYQRTAGRFLPSLALRRR